MLTVNEYIDFGGSFSIRARLSDPFNPGHYVDWSGSTFKFIVQDLDKNLIVDSLTAVQGGVNTDWWSVTDSPDEPNTVFNLDIPQAVTAALTFENARYTVWVLYPSGYETALVGGLLVPSQAVPPPP